MLDTLGYMNNVFYIVVFNVDRGTKTSKFVFTEEAGTQLVANSKFLEADISEEIEQETVSIHTPTVSVSSQTNALEQDKEEGGNKENVFTSTVIDDIATH